MMSSQLHTKGWRESSLLPLSPGIDSPPKIPNYDDAFPAAMLPESEAEMTPMLMEPMMTMDAASLGQPTQESLNDPLNSPHPVPWNWVLQTYEIFQSSPHSQPRHYRSVSVISPDQQYATYSRIQMAMDNDFLGCQVTSVMFLEDLRTGELQTITAASPLAISSSPTTKSERAGTFSILIPVSWSQTGDRLLARQFEGLLSTSIASDYAVMWDCQTQQVHTIAPRRPHDSNAILLGWSSADPNQVLFRVGTLGEEPWLLWRASTAGQTTLAADDQPLVFGHCHNASWSGAQLTWS